MIIYTDRVIDKLDRFIGRHAPERGGALLALPESNIVVDFLPDPDGEMTGSSYVPSRVLAAAVQAAERDGGLSFCGVVHSHPGGFDQPSGQDDVAFRKGLDLNRHLSRFVAPIITVDGPAKRGSPFQRSVGIDARMTSYVAYRSTHDAAAWPNNRSVGGRSRYDDGFLSADWRRELYEGWSPPPPPPPPIGAVNLVRDTPGHVRLVRTALDVMPVGAEIEALRLALEAKLSRVVECRPGPVIELGGVPCLSESLRFDGGDVMVILPPTFPFTAPVVVEGSGSQSREVAFSWRLNFATARGSLANALIAHLGGDETWPST